MDSHNDLSDELIRRLSGGGGLGKSWTIAVSEQLLQLLPWSTAQVDVIVPARNLCAATVVSQLIYPENLAEEVISSEIFEETNIYEDANDVENEPDDIIIVHMDIREPLSTLKYIHIYQQIFTY